MASSAILPQGAHRDYEHGRAELPKMAVSNRSLYLSPQVRPFSVIASGEAPKQSRSSKHSVCFWIATAAKGRLAMTGIVPEPGLDALTGRKISFRQGKHY
jgi:hypothetical protein